MPTNHIEKRTESSGVDNALDRHLECGSWISLLLATQMYLLSYFWKKALSMFKF